jgi:hypothetical protein
MTCREIVPQPAREGNKWKKRKIDFFTQNFFIAHNSSLLAGTYFSWFYDGME